ncbi:MAG: carbohydrate-binding module family 20 domain-containing protein [Bacteroidota bacterium]|nr:carbohydrate-binding module family 20 domain-containing protein [Bacteroidota bacterium]
MSDIYQHRGETIYLVLIYHQHQPIYIDYEKDHLVAPWVRTHSTKDYYRMPAMVQKYPNVHCTMNLTPSLLKQIEEYYLRRLKPNINRKTDVLFDLLIKPAEKFTRKDIHNLYKTAWSALSVNEVVRKRFPEFDLLHSEFTQALKNNFELNNRKKLRELKFWFPLANFDLDFLEAPMKLTDGTIIDISDIVERKADHKYYLRKPVTEADCQRLAVVTYKLMSNIIPIHKKLAYDSKTNTGQIELITTPFNHPIIPLICNSDVGKVCMPHHQFPKKFSYPDDAKEQVKQAIKFYKEKFGTLPIGLWPSEGSVSEEALEIFLSCGIKWVATDMQILRKSSNDHSSHLTPYKYKDSDGAIFFRDTELSDRVSFKYQYLEGEEAADDFIKYVLTQGHREKKRERILTVIMDGENAWEWFHRDYEGKEFLNALYRKLEKLFHTRQIVTVTPAELIYGNPKRNIPPHPIEGLPKLPHLAPGSWIQGDFSKWVGSKEKNQEWELLLQVRSDLEKHKVPHCDSKKLKLKSKLWYANQAWHEMYAAEGSDWFWWAGENQESPSNKKPFDELFLQRIERVYTNANKAGYKLQLPNFPKTQATTTIIKRPVTKIKTMQTGRKMVRVIFLCDARKVSVKESIYIAGNVEELGEWNPNSVKMYDDATHGDIKAKDGIWALEVQLPEGKEISYKYTNSGKPGVWSSSEEFPAHNRTAIINADNENKHIVKDLFGKL